MGVLEDSLVFPNSVLNPYFDTELYKRRIFAAGFDDFFCLIGKLLF